MKSVKMLSVVVLLVLLIGVMSACGTGADYLLPGTPRDATMQVKIQTALPMAGTGVPGGVSGQPMSGGTPFPDSGTGMYPVDPTVLTLSETVQAEPLATPTPTP